MKEIRDTLEAAGFRVEEFDPERLWLPELGILVSGNAQLRGDAYDQDGWFYGAKFLTVSEKDLVVKELKCQVHCCDRVVWEAAKALSVKGHCVLCCQDFEIKITIRS